MTYEHRQEIPRPIGDQDQHRHDSRSDTRGAPRRGNRTAEDRLDLHQVRRDEVSTIRGPPERGFLVFFD